MSFKVGFPESIAISFAELATQVEPTVFVERAVDAISTYSPWKSLAYFGITQQHGFHFHYSKTISIVPAQIQVPIGAESAFSKAVVESLGEPLVISELKRYVSLENDPGYIACHQALGSRPAAIVASSGILPGMTDGLVIFEEPGAPHSFSQADRERMWQFFTAIRLGLKVATDSWIKSESRRIENRAVMLVDRNGYFLSSNAQQTALLLDHLRSKYQNFLINDRRLAIDKIQPQFNKDNTAYIAGLEIKRSGQFYSVAINRNALLDGLSPRERQIADLIAAGQSYKSIGMQLGIALSTVSNISTRIRMKLGLASKEEIAVMLNHSPDMSTN